MTTERTLIDEQLDLERESFSLGVERYNKLRDSRSETEMAPGRRLVLNTVDALAQRISQFVAEADTGKPGKRHTAVKWFRHLDPHGLAYLTATWAVNSLSKANTAVTTVATDIGVAIAHDINFGQLRKKHPGLHRVIQQQLKKSTSDRHATNVMNHAVAEHKDADFLEFTNKDQLLIGMVLLEFLVGTTDLFEMVTITKGRNERKLILRGTDKTLEWIDKAHQSAALFHPVLLPMVCPPRPWVSPTEGGYYSAVGHASSLVRTRNKQYLRELELAEMPNVYAAINAIQATPWKVNTAVLDVMRAAWDAGGRIGGLPDRELAPLPDRPSMLDTDPEFYKEHHADEFKAWKRSRATVYEENARGISKRVAAAQKIAIAEKFRDRAAIYFPHNMDFRGRVYPIPPMLSPQGDDQAKSLLTFARGVRLGKQGAYWLAVHLANCFGVDKVSFEERVAWVREHEDQILDSAMSPLDGQRFWTDADSPYCALAACFEWLGFKYHGEDYISHLPVALDGSCNGLQNFSAMLLDPVGGAATNLIPQLKPADIYTQVKDVAQAKIRERAEAGDPLAIRLDGNLTRNIVKQPVMTLPYGVTMNGMKGQLLGQLQEHGFKEDAWELAGYLASVLWESIGEVVVAAREAMDWLKAAAKVAAAGGHPVCWTTPAGFPVLQDYREQIGTRVQPHVGGRLVNIVVNITGTKLDQRRQTLGISPNFVHSCDASHLMLTTVVAQENGVEDFAMIHDSFGTHAGNTGILSAALRHAFVEQYSGDVLGTFRKELEDQLPVELAVDLPSLPSTGNLDLNLVLDAPYFFA